MIRIRLHPPLTRIIGVREFTLDVVPTVANPLTIETLFHTLQERHPKFKEAIYDQDGKVSLEYLCVLNGEALPRHEGLCTPLKDGDEIELLMPISGGRG